MAEKVFSIGLRTTLVTPKDADEGNWYGGVQARWHMTPGLALEGSIDGRRSSYYGDIVTIKVNPVQLSLLAYLAPGAKWSPFVLGGAGRYYLRVEGPFDYNRTYSRSGLHAGVGLEVKLMDSLSLDGSYRYVWLEKVTYRDLNGAYRTYQDSGSMVTLAANFLF